MKARLIIRRRVVYGDRDFAELVVWQVPKPVPPAEHSFKYRLVYVVEGERVIGFDNQRGKGDHRHHSGQEIAYRFLDVDTLVKDFVSAVEQWRALHGKG